MKVFEEAQKVGDTRVCSSETEIVCSHCQDPVSQQEEESGVCTNCGQPWKPKQSVAIWATSVKAGVRVWGK